MATPRMVHSIPGAASLARAATLAVLLIAGRAGAQCAVPHSQKLAAPVPSTNAWFGDVIRLDGNVAFIGAQFDDYLCPGDGSCDAGSVQVMTFGGGSWTATQRLVASAAQPNEYFGKSIAVSGSRALVGAYGHDSDLGAETGCVYDFRHEGGQWVEHGILEASDASGGDLFGWQVVMEGDVAVIAAQSEGDAGAVYVLRLVADEWVEEQKLVPAVATPAAAFGFSLAIDGGRILVSAVADSFDRGSAWVFEHDGQSWVERQKLIPPLGVSGDRFGHSVDIRGDFLLVGATHESVEGPVTGGAHLYWYDGQDWLHVRRLAPSDPGFEGWFGSVVALGENLAVISAYGLGDIAEDAGQAYAFLFDGMNWTEAAKLRPAEVDEKDHFGSALAIQGSEVMIGATGDDDPCGGGICGAGAVYVFRPLANCNGNASIDRCEIEGGQAQDCNANGIPDACDIAGGTSADCDGNGVPDACDLIAGADCNDNQVPDACDITAGTSHDCNGNGIPDECDPFSPPVGEQKRLASAPATSDHYGSAVAVLDDVAVVGAPDRDSQGADAGAAYVLRRANGLWSQEAALVPGDITSFDLFGCAVAAERDLVLVGAELVPTGGSAAGAVYAYRFANGKWSESAKVTPAVLQVNMRFGHSVAVCGDLFVAGAPREGGGGAAQRGAAYVFRHDGVAWVEEAMLTAPVFAAGDQFGSSVAIDGDVVVVGEPWDDDVNNGAGAAHVFRFDGTGWVHEAKLVNPAGAAFDYFGTSVAVSGDRVAVGALRGTVGGLALGAVYVHRFDGQAWVLEATLTTGTNQVLTWFGCSASMAGGTLLVGAYAADIGQVRSGAAFLFELAGGQWNPRATLQTSDLAQSDEVGCAVALDGRSLALGARYEDDGGDAAGAAYLLDVPVGGPQVTRQPSSLRVALGARASFAIAAVGPGPLTYRWQKDGQDLADGGGVTGAATPRLELEAAGVGDPGTYRCVVSCDCGSTSSREATLFVDGVLAVGDGPAGPRLEFTGTHPNPFGSSTRVEFRAPAHGRVRIEVFSLLGERVADLLDEEVGPGPGVVTWPGTNSLGTAVPSGVYVCRISGFGQQARRKLTLLR